MKKTVLIIMIITLVSKVTGLLRDVVLSYFYGASAISDAYLVSITISSVLFGFILTGISTGYIPLYKKIESENGLNDAYRFTNNLVNLLFIITSIMVVFGLVFTEQIVKLFASGFAGDALMLTVKFTKISLLSIYTICYSYFFSSFLQLKGNYFAPALIGFPLNLISIIAIFLSANTNTIYLAIGGVIATASQLIFLIPFSIKNGYKYKFIIDFKDDRLKQLAIIALPIVLGTSVNEINVLIDRTVASHFSEGGISALNYANMLNVVVQGIFVVSIVSTIYPLISQMAVVNNMDKFKNTVLNAMGTINLIILPITFGAMFFSEPITSMLFGRGAFNENAVTMTSNALFYFSIGMIGIGLREILSKAFYALHDTKTPMKNATIAVLLNIVLIFVFSNLMGISGLALATSISSNVCAILMLISLKRKIGSLNLKVTIISFIKILVASLCMSLLSRLLYNNILDSVSPYFALIISVVFGIVVYFITISFMKINEVTVMLTTIKTKMYSFGNK